MFTVDECENFWEHYELKLIFGKLFVTKIPQKDKPTTYFLIKNKSKDKKFLRITNNFFIEI